MKIFSIAAPVFLLFASIAVTLCLLTDWNDGLFLPIGLGMGTAGNICNVLSDRQCREIKEAKE